MNYMLDTNILIYFIKQRPYSVVKKINALEQADQVVMSFFSYAELLKGVERSSKKEQALVNLAGITQHIEVLYPRNALICQHYATQFQQLKQAGTPIGHNDLWIAAHALAEKAVIVTNNVREFERIAGLKTENWVE